MPSDAAIEVKRLRPVSGAFLRLAEESRLEGYWMLVRLRDGWADGSNRFRKRGEALYGAWSGGALVGVCGLNVDPYFGDRAVGRVRHLYVAAAARRRGVGSALLRTVIERAGACFRRLNVRAPREAFAFYESLGFRPVADAEFVTHEMVLARAGVAPAGKD